MSAPFPPVDVVPGTSPLVLSFPHSGTDLPPDIAAQLNETGQNLSDTDWHVPKLYDGLLPGASQVRARFHRYVIDPNRDPSGKSLYPGQATTGLVPLTTFDDLPIWRTPPDAAAIEDRRQTYHTAYHQALAAELERVRAIHGVAILYDCHSIRSQVPRLFDGTLPDFNIGTNGGATCAPALQSHVEAVCDASGGYRRVSNGRFRGGWITRHYGDPARDIHAIQMELAQSTYLRTEDAPWAYDPAKAARLREPLKAILEGLAILAQETLAQKALAPKLEH